jgi:hypothetical protein
MKKNGVGIIQLHTINVTTTYKNAMGSSGVLCCSCGKGVFFEKVRKPLAKKKNKSRILDGGVD